MSLTDGVFDFAVPVLLSIGVALNLSCVLTSRSSSGRRIDVPFVCPAGISISIEGRALSTVDLRELER